MRYPELGRVGRHAVVGVNWRPGNRRCRSYVGTRFLLNLRQSRSDATRKERCKNGPRAADAECTFPRRPKLLCGTGSACSANGRITSLESGKISRTEGIPAL